MAAQICNQWRFGRSGLAWSVLGPLEASQEDKKDLGLSHNFVELHQMFDDVSSVKKHLNE